MISLLPPTKAFLLSLFILIMNMLIWNCRGAINPTFCDVVNELVRLHSPAIMIIVETKVSGDRARRILENLDLDGQFLQIQLVSLEVCGFSGILPR